LSAWGIHMSWSETLWLSLVCFMIGLLSAGLPGILFYILDSVERWRWRRRAAKTPFFPRRAYMLEYFEAPKDDESTEVGRLKEQQL
jgi:hypothetical protein